MAGISDQALQFGKYNKLRFNGGNEQQNKEFSDGSGLELCDANFRLYDAQIGRFHQPDPLADIFEDNSPYAFALNNPILLNDPLGLAADTNFGHIPDIIINAPPKPKSNDQCIPCGATDNGSGANYSFIPSPSVSFPVGRWFKIRDKILILDTDRFEKDTIHENANYFYCQTAGGNKKHNRLRVR